MFWHPRDIDRSIVVKFVTVFLVLLKIQSKFIHKLPYAVFMKMKTLILLGFFNENFMIIAIDCNL